MCYPVVRGVGSRQASALNHSCCYQNYSKPLLPSPVLFEYWCSPQGLLPSGGCPPCGRQDLATGGCRVLAAYAVANPAMQGARMSSVLASSKMAVGAPAWRPKSKSTIRPKTGYQPLFPSRAPVRGSFGRAGDGCDPGWWARPGRMRLQDLSVALLATIGSKQEHAYILATN